jgi:hypothetical protein
MVEKQKAYERREVILGSRADQGSAPRATSWHVNAKEQTMGRVVSILEGMTLAEGLRTLGGFSERELARATEFRQEPLALESMLILSR